MNTVKSVITSKNRKIVGTLRDKTKIQKEKANKLNKMRDEGTQKTERGRDV